MNNIDTINEPVTVVDYTPVKGIHKDNMVLSTIGYIEPVVGDYVELVNGDEFEMYTTLNNGFVSNGETDVLGIMTEDGYTILISGDQTVPTRDRGVLTGYELMDTDFLLVHNNTLVELHNNLNEETVNKIKYVSDVLLKYGKLELNPITNNVIFNVNSDIVDCSNNTLQLLLLELGIKSSLYATLIINGTHLSRMVYMLQGLNSEHLSEYNDMVNKHGLDSRFNEFSSKIGTIGHVGVTEVVEPVGYQDNKSYVVSGIIIKK